HTRILWAMYDGGYRPDRGYFKCSRVVGDVMGQYHPHGDSAIYDALVRLAQPWSMRMPLIDSQGNFGSPGNDPPAAMRYTECRLAPLAMEMLRDIDKDTVDVRPNYDGRSSEAVVLPRRFPNLLVNGSEGIAVGMATKIPPHNLREVAAGVQWYLENFDATDEDLLAALIDGVPRTLRLDQLVRHWVTHQIEVVVRRTRYLLRKAQERAHIVRALLKAIDRIDEVIALIRGSESAAVARQGLMDLLEIDE